MRRQAMAMSLSLLVAPGVVRAQSENAAEDSRTAEQFIETAHEAYSVRSPRASPAPAPTGNEIVVQARRDVSESQRLSSPTERAYAAGQRPPDRIPDAPYVFGLPECGVEVTCHRIGRAPPPIYLIDFAALPEPLTPEEAVRVRRAEDAPLAFPTPAEASPAAVP